MPPTPPRRDLLHTPPSTSPRHNLPRVDTSPSSIYPPLRSSTHLSPFRRERRVASDDSGRTVRVEQGEETPVGSRSIDEVGGGEGEVGWMMDQLAGLPLDDGSRFQSISSVETETEGKDTVGPREWDAFLDRLNIDPFQRQTMHALPSEKKLRLLSQRLNPEHFEPEMTDSTSLHPNSSSSDTSELGILGWTKKLSISNSFPWPSTSSSQIAYTQPGPQISALTALRQLSTTSGTTSIETRPLVPQDTGGSLWSWWSFSASSAGEEEEEVEIEKVEEKEERLLLKALEVIGSCNDRMILYDNLKEIRVILSTGPLSTLRVFFDNDGSKLFVSIFKVLLNGNIEKKPEIDSRCLLELLRSVRALLNTEIGYTNIISTTEILFFIVSSTYLSDTSSKVRCLAAELSAAVCALQRDSNLVLEAFLDTRVTYRETFRFEMFVKSFGRKDGEEDREDTEMWEWRTSGLMLINSVIEFTEDRESRISLRGELKRRGLNEQIMLWKYSDVPESLEIQIAGYEESYSIDTAYLDGPGAMSPIASPTPSSKSLFLDMQLKVKKVRRGVTLRQLSFRPSVEPEHVGMLESENLTQTSRPTRETESDELEAEREAAHQSDSGINAEESLIDEGSTISSGGDRNELPSFSEDDNIHPQAPPPPSLPSQISGTISGAVEHPYISIPDDEEEAPPPTPPPPPPPALPPLLPGFLASIRSFRPDNHSTPPIQHSEGGPPPPPPPLAPGFLTSIRSIRPDNQSIIRTLDSERGPPPPLPPLPPGFLASIRSISSDNQSTLPILDSKGGPPPPPPSAPAPLPGRNTNSSTEPTPKLPQKSPKLKPLFWQPMKLAPADSIWARVAKWTTLHMDSEELARLFQVVQSRKLDAVKSNKTGGHAAPIILEMSRANNIAIMLSRIPMTFPQIRSALLSVDVEDLTTDALLNIQRNLPTSDESYKLKAYSAEVSKLGRPERFLLELLKIPRLSSRLKCILFQREFAEHLEGLLPDLKLLHTACNDLRWNDPLEHMLASILATGNTLNAGTFRGDAAGFSLFDLTKLAEVRTQAGSAYPSLLHYLARLWLQSPQPAMINCLQSRALRAAARLSPNDVFLACRELVTGFQDVVKELDIVKAELPVESDRFVEVFQPFILEAESKITKMGRMMAKLDSEIRQTLIFFGLPDADHEVFSTLLQALATFDVQLQSAAETVGKDILTGSARKMSDGKTLEAAVTSRSSQPVKNGQLDATLHTMRTMRGASMRKGKESRRLNRIMWDGGSAHTRM